MKKSYDKFLTLVKNECKNYGVQFEIRNTSYVKTGIIKCSGYFDDAVPLILVAGKRDGFKTTLAHEYCHLTQWVDGLDLFIKSDHAIKATDRWLLGNRVNHIEEHMAICRDLELDNEIRTSHFVRKYDLDISVDNYIKMANAYVLSYNWLLVSRKWSKPGNSPYSNKRLIAAMSNKFDMDYETLDPNIYKIFKEEKI